jgi:murein L,D-transpeptidase YcbB/YkuD
MVEQRGGAAASRVWIYVVAGVALLAALIWFVPGPWSPMRWSGGDVGPQLRQLLAAEQLPDELAGVELDRRGLNSFYRARAHEPLWIGKSGLRSEADDLIEELKSAEEEGLDPADYHVEAIDKAVRSARLGGAEAAAALELMLSQAYADYTRDLRQGRIPRAALYTERSMMPAPITTLSALEDAADASSLSDHIDSLDELNPIYAGLRDALAQLRGGTGPSQVAIPDGETLKPGMSDPRVPALRQRLKVAASSSPVYDPATVRAVQGFQRSKGLKADGIIGKGTLAYLNAKPGNQAAVIVANMERARWLPADLGDKYLLADTAGFILRMYENGRQADAMRVVVGKEQQRTPSLVERMEYIEVNPYWNVPQSIIEEEIAPAVLAQGPGYLARRNMEVNLSWEMDSPAIDPSEVDWSAAQAGTVEFRVRQRPGRDNSLGLVKFMFPNEHDIYLHDTPADHLFAKELRVFSHGCVRVERPFDLAAWVLGGDVAPVREAMATGETKQIPLPKKLPVYIAYFTAWPTGDGKVEFRPDIYGRDRAMIGQLMPNA